MQLVVRGKEGARPGTSRLNGLETARISRMVFQGLGLRLTERIVDGGMRTAVTFSNPQVYQQLAQWLAFHRRAIVGMKGELVRLNAGFVGSFIDELTSVRIGQDTIKGS